MNPYLTAAHIVISSIMISVPTWERISLSNIVDRVLCNNVLSQVHAPIFTAFPASLTVARGAAASFEATLNAAPATVAWMKDGKEVKEQPMKHRITASGNKVM